MEKPDGFYPFLAKVFGDTLIQNGHEHISLMPFLLLNPSVGGLRNEMTNEKSDRILLLRTRILPMQNHVVEEGIRFCA